MNKRDVKKALTEVFKGIDVSVIQILANETSDTYRKMRISEAAATGDHDTMFNMLLIDKVIATVGTD